MRSTNQWLKSKGAKISCEFEVYRRRDTKRCSDTRHADCVRCSSQQPEQSVQTLWCYGIFRHLFKDKHWHLMRPTCLLKTDLKQFFKLYKWSLELQETYIKRVEVKVCWARSVQPVNLLFGCQYRVPALNCLYLWTKENLWKSWKY